MIGETKSDEGAVVTKSASNGTVVSGEYVIGSGDEAWVPSEYGMETKSASEVATYEDKEENAGLFTALGFAVPVDITHSATL